MASSRQEVIEDSRAIVDMFADLTRQSHDVTLRFDDVLIHYPVSVASVDNAFGLCLIHIANQSDVYSMLAEDRVFTLHACEQSGSVHSSDMRCTEILKRPERLSLRCALPELLEVVWNRNDFRATLKKDMVVTVTLQGAKRSQWETTLHDISMGGCLVSMPARSVDGLKIGDARYKITLGFPNGETFAVSGCIRSERTEATRGVVYLGIAFDVGSQKQKRDLGFYVSEIEREVARRSRERSELRALASSRLFPAQAKAG